MWMETRFSFSIIIRAMADPVVADIAQPHAAMALHANYPQVGCVNYPQCTISHESQVQQGMFEHGTFTP